MVIYFIKSVTVSNPEMGCRLQCFLFTPFKLLYLHEWLPHVVNTIYVMHKRFSCNSLEQISIYDTDITDTLIGKVQGVA